MSSDLNAQLLEILECPVCLTYMVPPIFECRRAHCVCSNCFFRIKRCPLCRGKKSGRCVIMEKLSSQVTFPCINVEEGCEFSAEGYAIKFHEIGCEFSWKRCPLSKLHTCKWSGLAKNMIKHFEENHPQSIYFESSPIITVSGMSQRTSRRSLSIVSAYDTVFVLFWDFNECLDEFRFSLTYYGYPTVYERFWYMVCVFDGDGEKEAVKMSALCHCIRADEEIFVEGHYVTLPFGVIPEFLSSEGNMRFVVKAFDNKVLGKS